jgi:UPF0755 protein
MRVSGKRILVFLVCLALAGGGFFFFLVNKLILRPGSGEAEYRTFEVQERSSLSSVAYRLEKEGLISSALALRLWAIYKGYSGSIKAGEYRLSPLMPPKTILELLHRGEVAIHAVRIAEGFNLRQIADAFAKEGIVNKEEFLKIANDAATANSFGLNSPSLEGFLFPDTYRFAKGLPAKTVINAMVERFFEMMGPFKDKTYPLDMAIEEIVTLASIVEKETAKAEERPLIAGVFVNRLKKKMPLASDPTVIYGLDEFDGNLRKKDLSNPSPYNTYRQKGLPPGPIASPGIEAIKAAVFPQETDYLYFVSKNDGTHYFSKTYDEHLNAVNLYQRKKTAPEAKELDVR